MPPPLPIPPLQHTLAKYLKTLAPLATPTELQNSTRLAKEFLESGEGARLQGALQEHAQNKPNWLHSWWLSVAYLGYRSPVVLFSNPGYLFADPAPTPDPQLTRASHLLYGMLSYKSLIDHKQIPTETIRDKRPLCMAQYERIFSACRIPRRPEDHLVVFPPEASKHVVVARGGQFFKMDVMDGKTGSPLPIENLKMQLSAVLREPTVQPQGVGILTSLPRDAWSDVHEELEKHPTNASTLNTIRTAIVVVCLDDDSPRTHSETLDLVLHGGGSTRASANRWFDKMQLIVGGNGKAGVLFEHSPLDAAVGTVMMEAASTTLLAAPQPPALPSSSVPPPSLLPWVLPPRVVTAIRRAGAEMDKLVSNIHFHALLFPAFGKERIKAHKLSPDAFFQITLQLAYYRLHGRTCATYETAHTRLFALGRTETIRSASSPSAAFTAAMDNPLVSAADRAALFRAAVAAHSAYTQEAMDGSGVDRHLLGLRLISKQLGLPLPKLFEDPLYQRSTHWALSTSTVAMATNTFPAFGPAVPDGYGLTYNIKSDVIAVGISTWRSDGSTCAVRIAEVLLQSLLDVDALLTSTAPAPKAKL